MRKRILVTGGAGFLGSNLCSKLVQDPDNYVIALDNLYTGKLTNIETLLSMNNFEFLKWDIEKPLDLRVDQIYNAACPASPPAYQRKPISTTRTCVIGVLNLLDLATANHASLLQFSTSEVYGDPLVHPQVEEYWGNVNPIGIRSCYDEGKRCAESLCFDYHRSYGTKIKIIRIFNTYGPNMDPNDGRVVSNFIVEALNHRNITIYGDGTQTRSFCYVSDLIEAIIRMMNSETDFTGPINLGNPGEFTIHELAEKVIRLTGSKSEICFCDLPEDDPVQRRPDISLAWEKLSWKPVVPLDDGLVKTIEYFRQLQ